MKKYTWYKLWARKFTLFLPSIFMETFNGKLGLTKAKNKLFVPESSLYAIYFEKSELAQIIKQYSKLLLKSNLKQYSYRYVKELESFLIWSKKFNKEKFDKFNDKKLESELILLHRKLISFTEIQFYPFLVLEGIEKEVEDAFRDNPMVLEAITTPEKLTKIMKSRLELWSIIKNKKISEVAARKFWKKYFWISIYDINDKQLSDKEIKGSAEGITDPKKEISNFKKFRSSNLKYYKDLLSSIQSPSLKKKIQIVHEFSYLKEVRDDYRRQSYYLIRPFFVELANRLHVTLDEVLHLTKDEIIDSLSSKDMTYVRLAKQRVVSYALWYKEGALTVMSGADAVKFVKSQLTSAAEMEIKGHAAYRGKVRGRVKVVLHRGEMSKFKKGDILVTGMTHVEFVPILKKAKAIVTDEGGITSHAAIMARELKVPCIIGTKYATKVFKDGDMVEVDAIKGLIKKI